MIFHGKKHSQEHIAAKELLALVRKEMATIPITKPPVEPSTVKSEPEKPEKQRIVLSKPVKTSTVVACGKRGSVKALTEIVGKKGDGKKEKEVEEKVVISEKKVDGEEKGVKKKRSKEMAVTGQRSSKTGNKSSEVKHEFGGNEISSHDTAAAAATATEVKAEKKENVVKKKQGAASFLKRIKQNSPGEVATKKNDENEDDDNDSDGDESKDEKEEEKKGKGKKKEVVEKKEIKVTRSSGGRGAREESGRGKRGGGRGRPPKRGTAAAAVEPSPVKRGRENGDNEAGSRARKRSRR